MKKQNNEAEDNMKDPSYIGNLTPEQIEQRYKYFEDNRIVIANIKHNGYLAIDELVNTLLKMKSIGANAITIEKKKNQFKAIRLPQKKKSTLITV